MCHVLVIEDDFFVADYIIQLLEGAGASSFAQAATQGEAVAAARAQPPAFIMSDVNLAEGTGPAAVETILKELGPCPVIFVTATPEACHPCEPPMVVLEKPIEEARLVRTFQELAPI